MIRKTGLVQFGDRDEPELRDIERALLDSNITNFKFFTTTDDMQKNFSGYLKKLDELSAIYDPDAGILLADKCLKAVWVTIFFRKEICHALRINAINPLKHWQLVLLRKCQKRRDVKLKNAVKWSQSFQWVPEDWLGSWLKMGRLSRARN